MSTFLIIHVEIPDGVSIERAKDYCITELKAAGGQRRPTDTLFAGLEVISIKAVRYKTDADTIRKRRASKAIRDQS